MTAPAHELLLLGISHRSASVAAREGCALNAAALRKRLEVVLALESVHEAWLISTCNRTEVLVVTSADTIAAEKRVKGAIREVIFRKAPYEAVYDYRGLKAILHVFRVAAGLDSQVLGESQILAQLNHLAFEIEEADFETEMKRLKDLGLTVTTLDFPHMQAKGMFFKDPEGNLIELICHLRS